MTKRRNPGAPAPSSWLPWLIAAVPAIAFFPVVFNGFVWDDQILLVGNSHFRGLGLSNLLWMFSAPRFGQYHPLTWMNFGLDYLFFGLDPAGYHVENLLLHCANALLVYYVACSLLAKALPEAPEESVRFGAGFAALFFALHPLRVETVAWVTERRGLLSSFFLLGAFLAYLKEETLPALALYVASLFCKASGVVFPAVLLLVDWYPLGRKGRESWLEKLLFVVAAIPFGLVAPLAQAHEGALQPLSAYGVLPRLGQAAFATMFYLVKTVAPLRLSPFVRFPDRIHFLLEWPIAGSLVACVAITAAVLAFYRSWPAALVLWGSYLAWLAPVSGLVQSGPHFVADRYSYLACIGWAVLAGAGFMRALAMKKEASWALGGAVLLALGALSWRQTRIWQSSRSLWTYTLSLDPRSYLAHNNLCTALRDEGRRSEALEHCRAALELRPDYAQAHCNLGNLLLDDGKVEDAIGHFSTAIRIEPEDPISHFDLAVALDRSGHLDQAINEYRSALALKPDYAAALNNLGAALALEAHSDEAEHEFQSVLAADPADAKAHFNLGNVYYQRQRFDLATREFEQALKAAPNDVRTQLNLGVCLNALGRPLEAVEHFRAAIRLKPDFAEAFNNLGIALFQLRRFHEAVENFQKAVRLKPDYSDARFNLDRAAKLLSGASVAR